MRCRRALLRAAFRDVRLRRRRRFGASLSNRELEASHREVKSSNREHQRENKTLKATNRLLIWRIFRQALEARCAPEGSGTSTSGQAMVLYAGRRSRDFVSKPKNVHCSVRGKG